MPLKEKARGSPEGGALWLRSAERGTLPHEKSSAGVNRAKRSCGSFWREGDPAIEAPPERTAKRFALNVSLRDDQSWGLRRFCLIVKISGHFTERICRIS